MQRPFCETRGAGLSTLSYVGLGINSFYMSMVLPEKSFSTDISAPHVYGKFVF